MAKISSCAYRQGSYVYNRNNTHVFAIYVRFHVMFYLQYLHVNYRHLLVMPVPHFLPSTRKLYPNLFLYICIFGSLTLNRKHPRP